MLDLLLVAAMFNQDFENTEEIAAAAWTPPNATRIDDLHLEMAVEDFVRAQPGTAPPGPYKGMIDDLGLDDWRAREEAGKRLLEASRADHRWLFWARKHKDLEIRVRSNNILRKLNPCTDCNGTGKNKFYDGNACYECHGLKTLWLWTPWD